jgi:hypothetical protein
MNTKGDWKTTATIDINDSDRAKLWLETFCDAAIIPGRPQYHQDQPHSRHSFRFSKRLKAAALNIANQRSGIIYS